jgi:hypothetical protein
VTLTPSPLASGLFDYWEYSAPGFIPSMSWMTPPPVRPGVDTRTQVRTAVITPDMDLVDYGFVAVYHVACDRSPAAGNVMEVSYLTGDEHPPVVYYENGTLNPLASQTDANPISVAYNVKPGSVVVRIRRADGNTLVSEQAVLVRAKWGTLMLLPPTPL